MALDEENHNLFVLKLANEEIQNNPRAITPYIAQLHYVYDKPQ